MPTVEHGKFLNQLPSDWEKVPISALGEVHAGSTPRRSNHKYWNGSIAWVTPGELTDLKGKWLSETSDRITEAGLNSCSVNLMPPGTILVTTRATIGNIAISTIPITTNQGFKSIVPDGTAEPEFYYYMLQLIIPEMQRLASGSTFNEISGRNFASIIVPRPPIAEQRRIAEILDTADAAIQQTEAVIAKLKQVKTGLLHDLLTRGLDENGQFRDPEAHPEQFKETEIGRVPRGWGIKKLDKVTVRITDGVHQAVKKTDDGTVPFLFVSCIRDGRIHWDRADSITEEVYEEISKGREPQPGVVLYTLVGSYGHAATVEGDRRFSFQRHVGYIIPDIDRLKAEFLVLWLNSPMGFRHANVAALGNAQKTITLGELAKFPVPVPKLNEQERIIEGMQSHQARISAEEAYRDKLQQVKQGLMQDLLTGRVRV